MVLSNNIDPAELREKIRSILINIGGDRSTSQSVAYDTAWIARLSAIYPQKIFSVGLEWLRKNQHDDGSWGGEIFYLQDRVLSTLIALIALKQCGQPHRDRKAIEKGEVFLWRSIGQGANHTNISDEFALLFYALVTEANTLHLDVPQALDTALANRLEQIFEIYGPDMTIWLTSSLGFSFEGFRHYLKPTLITLADNGSLGASPSATAAYLLTDPSTADKDALAYLLKALAHNRDGGIGFAYPFNVLETALSLIQLRTTGLINSGDEIVRSLLEFLWSQWDHEAGVGISSYSHAQSLTSTALVFQLLKWGGYPVSSDVFNDYESEKGFLETPRRGQISLLGNLHTLEALRIGTDYGTYRRWKNKVVDLLIERDTNGYYWQEHGHLSPFFFTYWVTSTLLDTDDTRLHLQSRIQWMLKTQQRNGGWGYFQHTTAEETAYCLLTLLAWDFNVRKLDPRPIHMAGHFLQKHLHDTKHPAMWIAKTCYTPLHVVDTAIVSALENYQQYCKSQG